MTTVEGTVLGASFDNHQAVLTILKDDGSVTELLIKPDMVVLPDECFLDISELPVN